MSRRPYQIFQPHPRLRVHVEAYLLAERTGELTQPAPFRIMPDGSAHLIFRVLGDDDGVLRTAYSTATCDLRFVGPRSVFKDTDLRRRARTLIVRFRPGGAVAFVPVFAAEMADRSCDLDLLARSEGGELLERLASAGTVENQVRVLEAALLRRLDIPGKDAGAVPEAVRRLGLARGCVRVRALADELGLSERQLRNQFYRHVGLSPKTYARILRVRHVVDRIGRREGTSWAALAVEAGFFDQSHLIHDFHALLGETPDAFAARL